MRDTMMRAEPAHPTTSSQFMLEVIDVGLVACWTRSERSSGSPDTGSGTGVDFSPSRSTLRQAKVDRPTGPVRADAKELSDEGLGSGQGDGAVRGRRVRFGRGLRRH